MKPTIKLNCVASHYASPQERIIEFYHKNGGGLISFLPLEEGTLHVAIYRCDPTVRVTAQIDDDEDFSLAAVRRTEKISE